MRETTAQAVLLVRAFEEADPEGRLLTLAERKAATEAARAQGSSTDADAVVATRAQRLLGTLEERVAGLPRLMSSTRILAGFAPIVVVAGLGLGLLVNKLGSGHKVQLVPLLFALCAFVAWNVLMYAFFLLRAMRRRAPRAAPTDTGASGPPGVAGRLLEWTIGRFSRSQARRRVREAGVVSAAVTRYLASWGRAVGPLLSARARLAFHLGSLALATGLVVGMYVRGLGFRYRATWESTFLDADGMHAFVRFVFAPASWITGRAVPSYEEIVAAAGGDGVPAAPWIVLYAATVIALVVVPRALLAVVEIRAIARLSRDLPVDLGVAYAARSGGAGVMPGVRVDVLPYSHRPTPRAADALRALLHDVFGTGAAVEIAEPIAYGVDGDDVPVGSSGKACRLLLVSTAQTPEAEVHGRLVREMLARRRAGDRFVVVADDSAYRERIGDRARVEERRRGWERVGAESGAAFVALDLGQRASDDATRLAAAVGAVEAGR